MPNSFTRHPTMVRDIVTQHIVVYVFILRVKAEGEIDQSVTY